MDNFDRVYSYLIEEEGLSPQDATRAMVIMVEQGFDPTQVFLHGLKNMLFPKPAGSKIVGAVKKNINTPVWGPENAKGTTQPNFVTGSGKISKPIITGKQPWMVKLDPVSSSNPQPSQTPTQPRVSPGQMQIPGTSNRAQELRNVTRNPNTGLPGTKNTGLTMSGGSNATRSSGILRSQTPRVAPSLPKAPTPSVGLFSRLRNIRGGLASTALNVATAGALDKAAQPLVKAGSNIIGRTVYKAQGKENKAQQAIPSLYGRSGPDLTPGIVRGVQQRDKLEQQKAETQAASQPTPKPTGERSASANTAKQDTAKANAERRRAAAASFDRAFAAARAKGEDTFPWRGKTYSTKLK